MAAVGLLPLLMTVKVRGQSALDGFDPNANGAVGVVVVQPDGKILIGGDFTSLAPNGGPTVTRNRIARLNSDGTLDTAFNPNANATVYSIAVQTDGKILVGGAFSGSNSIGGQTRNRIARLEALTGSADSFNPNANDIVQSIAFQTDGKILVGGAFNGANSIGGQSRNFIARVDASTGAADSFNPNANSGVNSIVVQPDGKILVGGFFNGANGIGGQTRNYLARLDPATGLADSFNPNPNDGVLAIALQADGNILAGGDFSGAIGGAIRNRIARLDAVTGLADSFNPNAQDEVRSIVVQADGKILVGGVFLSVALQNRKHIARLNPNGALDIAFDPNASNTVNAIAVQADGKILVGGFFATLTPNGGGNATRNRIARLEIDGRLDRTLDLSTVGQQVEATALQADGKILIGGSFTSVLGVARNNMARLNTDGTPDIAFDPNANGEVISIGVQADGKILAGGSFTSIGGQTRNHIARLDPVTGLADSFNPNANDSIFAIAVQADGKIVAGGRFQVIGGEARNRIARLDANGFADPFDPNADERVFSILVQADGRILVGGIFARIGGQMRNGMARLDATTGLADSFNPDANIAVEAIAVQADGRILVGGDFTSIGGQTRNHIARLDTTGAVDLTFDPNANNNIFTIAVQADGKILAGGAFGGPNSIGGQTRNNMARLDPVTGLADSFDPNASTTVESIAVQADGKILAGGFFATIGGQTRDRIARLSNGNAALQDVAVTQNTVAWTRGGAGPQFARVTFESSTNNVDYTPIGNGMPQSGSSNWILTGLNLPIGQNIYIRARGYYESGLENGSGSIQESVRNAFLVAGPPPTPTPTPIPTATPPTPTPTPTPGQSPTPTPTPGVTPIAVLGNISTRLRVLAGDNALIGGMIATGTAGKRVIIRAIGPSLTGFGVAGALVNPTLDLFQGNTLLMSNDDWQNSTQQAEISASGLAPSNSAESAIIWTLTPGQTYTAAVRGLNNTTGIGLVEAYDLDQAAASKLGNISTRGFVDVDDNVMIAGLIAGPSNGGTLKILVRALGPTLTDFGVPGALANPTLDLVNSSGTVIRSNDNWQDDASQSAQIQAAGLAPGHPEEAALVETVSPGQYTAVVRGRSGTTGVGLVETYNIP